MVANGDRQTAVARCAKGMGGVTVGFDVILLIVFFVSTILVVTVSIEGGYRLGRIAHSRSEEEKESPVSAIAGAVLALLAFILAFTFGIASNRFDARKELVRDDANKIRTAWLLSDFVPETDRAEVKGLIRKYLELRLAASQSGNVERLHRLLIQSEQIQDRLWTLVVKNAKNMEAAFLFIGSFTAMFGVQASRLAVGLQDRIPETVWGVLGALTILGMITMGYRTGIAGSKRTLAMPLLAIAFASVITLIASLDRPFGGLTRVSQQPLVDLLSSISQTR
jgi:hypothetical protein